VAGQWKEFAIDFTTPSGLSSAPGNAGGRPITIDLVACCQGISNQLTDWFISPAPVPAPLAGPACRACWLASARSWVGTGRDARPRPD
jgi:hypothetical protein